jgi:TolB-like protein/DNA-binding SARP family transcriptional activator
MEMASARWSLRLLGGFELCELSGGAKVVLPAKRDRVLLAYLALSPGCRQPRRKLTALLWGDAADETALDNLRVCIWSLRKALGDADHRVLASEGEDIVLDAAAFEVDVLLLRDLAVRDDLEQAAKLASGEFLAGLSIDSEEFESWRREEAMRYKDQAVAVLTRLMTQLAERGASERAIEAGARILRLEPLHEEAVRGLMRLYGDGGRRGAAIELYRTLADTLHRELNVQPEAKTRAVFAEVTRGGEQQSVGPAAVRALPPHHSAIMARPADVVVVPRSAGQLASMENPPGVVAKRMGRGMILAAGLAAAIAAVVTYSIVPLTSTITPQPGIPVARKLAASAPVTAISIAVLPFANLSGDPGQDFFSDGITEEITATLAMVPDLRVVGRTSAYQFKGQSRDLRAIGQALSATHLLEGSVRMNGERVRITAQLIKADDGVNAWAENYDRELTDVFTIQEDIARAIATSLRRPLGLGPGETLVNNRGIDSESYQQFLRARSLGLRSGRGTAPTRLAILEPLVARYPDYAPASAELARTYASTIAAIPPGEARRQTYETYFPKMEAAAGRAIRLDPMSADTNELLGILNALTRKFSLSVDFFSKALAIDPNNPRALDNKGSILMMLGQVKAGLEIKRQLLAVEPFAPVYVGNAIPALWLDGQNEAALELASGQGGSELAEIYASMGRYSEAADLVASLPIRAYPTELTVEAARLLRTAPAKARSAESLPTLGSLGFIHLHIGAPERALEYYEGAVRDPFFNDHSRIAFIWHPSYAPVRKTERFKKFVRDARFVEYWRERGWPEFCRPVGADDFVCR